jgi:hypothetical protein
MDDQDEQLKFAVESNLKNNRDELLKYYVAGIITGVGLATALCLATYLLWFMIKTWVLS